MEEKRELGEGEREEREKVNREEEREQGEGERE